MRILLLCALVLAVCAVGAARGDDCCAQCGCQSNCRKVCRVICETKKVPKITYHCECEDFCLPGPSQRCRSCDCECGHKHWTYTPTCAEVRTRKKLVKTETMEEKCTYKWVVEAVCDCCTAKCGDATTTAGGGEPSPLQSLLPNARQAKHEDEAGKIPAAPASAEAGGGLKYQLRRVLRSAAGSE